MGSEMNATSEGALIKRTIPTANGRKLCAALRLRASARRKHREAMKNAGKSSKCANGLSVTSTRLDECGAPVSHETHVGIIRSTLPHSEFEHTYGELIACLRGNRPNTALLLLSELLISFPDSSLLRVIQDLTMAWLQSGGKNVEYIPDWLEISRDHVELKRPQNREFLYVSFNGPEVEANLTAIPPLRNFALNTYRFVLMEAQLLDSYKSAKQGLIDSVSFHRCLVLVVRSEKIRLRVLQCLLLNGIIFLGSILFFNFVLSPVLQWALGLVMVGKEALDFIHYWVEWIYFVLWIAPVYLLTFILNALWYQDIASESIRIYPMKRPPSFSSSIAGEIAGLIHRSIFNVCFLVYLAFIRNWKLLYLLNLSWLIAYNSFEYQWIHFKVSFETKIKTIETNWVYFSFFGLPLALIAFQFPSIIENGLISVAFPFVLMMASTASRPLCVGSGQWFQRMRILIVPDLMTRIFVFFLNFANRDRR